jgi:hypothetical protein
MGVRSAVRNTAKLLRLQREIRRMVSEGKSFAQEYIKLENIAGGKADWTVDNTVYLKMYNMATIMSIPGKQYAKMTSRELTEETLKVQALIGALAVAEDRLCDDLSNYISNERLDRMFENPQDYKPLFSADNVARELYLRLIELRPREKYPEYHDTLKSLHDIQKKSRRQNGYSLSADELWDISLKKGGYAMLALAHGMNPSLKKTDPEYQAIYSLGYIQIIDDVSDSVKDRLEGIQTPANTLPEKEVKTQLENLRDTSLRQIAALPYSLERKDWLMFNVYVLAIPALVALKHRSKGKFYFDRAQKINGIQSILEKFGQGLAFIRDCFLIGFEYDFKKYSN